MTLIISAATDAFLVHAADRLLTKKLAGKTRVHSGVENKSLIVVAKDAICLIGYTGTAYIGKVITDEWIASAITGEDESKDFALRQPGARNLRLNWVLWRLEVALRAATLPPSASYLTINVVGVRMRRGHLRPFIYELSRNRSVVKRKGYMRAPDRKVFHLLSQIGDPLPMEELQSVLRNASVTYGPTAEGLRRGLLDAIRIKSSNSDTVGDEVMTITITAPPPHIEVVWTFEAPEQRRAVITDSSRFPSRTIESFFSPWIITPAGVSKPSYGNGHLQHSCGNIRIRCGNNLNFKTDDGGMLMALSSQKRPKP